MLVDEILADEGTKRLVVSPCAISDSHGVTRATLSRLATEKVPFAFTRLQPSRSFSIPGGRLVDKSPDL